MSLLYKQGVEPGINRALRIIGATALLILTLYVLVCGSFGWAAICGSLGLLLLLARIKLV